MASSSHSIERASNGHFMPLPVTTQQWAERTPKNFVFNVKAFRLFTGHQAQPRVFPKDIQEALGLPPSQNVYYRDLHEDIQKELWGRFFQALEPLFRSGGTRVASIEQMPPQPSSPLSSVRSAPALPSGVHR